MSDSTKQLNEVRLSWSGKLLFATIAARLAAAGLRKLASSMSEQSEEEQKVEPTIPFNVSGKPEQIAAMTDVIKASKEYQEELKREGATVESVMEKLNAQNKAKIDFKTKTGYDWPL